MKKSSLLPVAAILLLLQMQAGADDRPCMRQSLPDPSPGVLRVSQQRALEGRADQLIEINDELIQRTLKANGGNYFHQGLSKILIFNHKIYENFTIRVIRGNRLVIETEDGAFQMDVIDP